MSAGLVGIVTLIYAAVAVNQLLLRSPWALVYFGYAVANVGTIWLLRK